MSTTEDSPTTVPETSPDRRIVLACGMILPACLGSVYAWSFFTKPLCEAYGWNKMQVSIAHSATSTKTGDSS